MVMRTTLLLKITPTLGRADQGDCGENLSKTVGFLVVSSIFKGGSAGRAFDDPAPCCGTSPCPGTGGWQNFLLKMKTFLLKKADSQ